MKFVFVVCLAAVIFFSVNSAAAQNFDYDRYKPRTLAEITELNTAPKTAGEAKKEFLVSGDWFHSQVRLKYIGTSRALSAERKEILNNWKTSFKIPVETANLY